MSKLYWDSKTKRYAQLVKTVGDNATVRYSGDTADTTVPISQLSPAGTVMNWFSSEGQSGDIQEIMFNCIARSGIHAIYDKKQFFDGKMKEFAMVETIYMLFMKNYVEWITNIMPNVPRDVTDPKAWFISQDVEGAVNHAIGFEITYQLYQMVMKKPSFKFNLNEIVKNIVAFTTANVVQRRSTKTGTAHRSQ